MCILHGCCFVIIFHVGFFNSFFFVFDCRFANGLNLYVVVHHKPALLAEKRNNKRKIEYEKNQQRRSEKATKIDRKHSQNAVQSINFIHGTFLCEKSCLRYACVFLTIFSDSSHQQATKATTTTLKKANASS